MNKIRAGERPRAETQETAKLGASNVDALTRREMDVLRLLVHGKTDAEIADCLGLSVATVKQYVQRIREKTRLRNRTELAVQAALIGIGFGL